MNKVFGKYLRIFVVADPRLTDYDTLLDNIHGLKDGKSVQVPIYDFKSSSRIGYRYSFSLVGAYATVENIWTDGITLEFLGTTLFNDA